MLDRDNNFYLIHLITLITCFLDSGWILKGEIACESLLGVKGLSVQSGISQTDLALLYSIIVP